VFQAIAQESLLQLHAPPDKDLLLPKNAPKLVQLPSKIKEVNESPKPVQATADNKSVLTESPDVITTPVERELVAVPDFHGLSKRTVLNRCLDLGIRLQASGSGMAVFQAPLPGTKIPLGATCSVSFAKGSVRLNSNAAIQKINYRPAQP
jgi:hypothetical protein